MKIFPKLLTASALGGLVSAAPTVGAVEFLYGNLSANVGAVSNYYFRGVTQTDDSAAVQGGLDWNHDLGIYLGTWASNVDFGSESDGNKASVEVDFYGGWDFDQWLPKNFRLGLNTIYYWYPDADSDNDEDDLDYWEVGASAGWRWISAGVQYTVYGQPDDGPFQEEDVYYYGGLDFELPKGFGLSGLIGRYDFDDGRFADDYTHWTVGLSKDAGKFGTFSLNYEQNNGDNGDAPADDDDPKFWVGWNITFE